jgi:Immunity protein 8
VKAVLKSLHSPDVDLVTFRPATNVFSILVQALIGPMEGDGQESFDFVLCSPAWLAEEAKRRSVVWGRGHLIVQHYDCEELEKAVRELCANADGPTWPTVAARLSRFTWWEFADYGRGKTPL